MQIAEKPRQWHDYAGLDKNNARFQLRRPFFVGPQTTPPVYSIWVWVIFGYDLCSNNLKSVGSTLDALIWALRRSNFGQRSDYTRSPLCKLNEPMRGLVQV